MSLKADMADKEPTAMSPVMRLLKIEHSRLRKLLEILDGQLKRIESGERGDFDIIEAVFNYCQTYADRCHHPRENVVFRRLQARGGDPDGGISDLLREHAQLGVLGERAAKPLHDLREDQAAAREWARTDGPRFVEINLRHLGDEERSFFPAAEKALNEQDWAEVEREIAASSNPDFGADTAKRFEYLLDYIANLDRLNQAAEPA